MFATFFSLLLPLTGKWLTLVFVWDIKGGGWQVAGGMLIGSIVLLMLLLTGDETLSAGYNVKHTFYVEVERGVSFEITLPLKKH